MTSLTASWAHWEMPIGFATPENEWATLFRGYVPDWLEPEVYVLDGYFTGQSSFLHVKAYPRLVTADVVVDAVLDGAIVRDDLRRHHHAHAVD